jgi:hypothetical protein
LLLPLKHTADIIDRVLGALVALDPPHWLGELPLSSKRVIAHELVWPAGAPTFVSGDSVRNDIPVLLASEHARVVRSERRQFRVFEGGLGRSDVEKP